MIQKFNGTYSSIEEDQIESMQDYLVSAFVEADKIDILVGYFRISFFQVLAPALVILFKRNVVVRIICGHQLSDAEEQLIFGVHDVTTVHENQLERILKRIWTSQFNQLETSELKSDVLLLMTEMLRRGQLEVKPIVVRNDAGQEGLFHQKEYFFYGRTWISRAIGSANMTATMLSRNSETLEVGYYELEEGKARFGQRIGFIEDLWNDRAINHFRAAKSDIVCIALSNSGYTSEPSEEELQCAVRRVLKSVEKKCRSTGRNRIKELFNDFGVFEQDAPEAQIRLRKHQELAVRSWTEHNFVGLFEMATGAGKTITAIHAAKVLEQIRQRAQTIIVIVPSIALIDQWYDELRNFYPRRAVFAASGAYTERDWKTLSRVRLEMFNDGEFDEAPILIGRHEALLKQIALWCLEPDLKNAIKNSLLIADECHSLGAKTIKKIFDPMMFDFRIGLSATPNRYMDEEGTKFVRDAFNSDPSSTFTYTLRNAIDDGYLVPYNYNPITFELDEDTQLAYVEITEKIRGLSHADEDSPAGEALKRLLMARVRIIMKSPAKKQAFKQWLTERIEAGDPSIRSMIVYAPEGFGTEDEDTRVIKDYQEIIAQAGLKSALYIGGGTRDRTADSPLDVFQRGNIEVLIAMKCLDEGVDLPRATCGVFLSSTGNIRQYIQRRGRLLRLFEKYGQKKYSALIVDFISLPKREVLFGHSVDADVEKSILNRELYRAAHFVKDALNFGEADTKLQHALSRLNHERLWHNQRNNTYGTDNQG
jgi:superfamily II DNA or RNA helicase/HKD family nuclease